MKRKNRYTLKTLGMATLTLVGTSSLAIAATPASTQLKEVIITGQKDRLESKGYTAKELSLPKFNQPLIHTPQSISVVSQQVMQDQHVTTMRDAVRNVAGISIAAGEGGAQGDSLTLRGFTARNDIFLDGMRDFGSYYRDAFNWESVEVLKGPASVAFGRGSTGGVINQVSKLPKTASENEVDISLGTNQKQRVTVDTNYVSPHKTVATRVTAMEETGLVTNRNVVQNNRWGIAPSVTFGLGSPTRVTLSHFHAQEDDIPDYGIPWLFNRPAPVNPNTYYGFRSDYLKTNADIATVKVEQDFGSGSLQNQLRYGRYTRNMRATEAKISGSPDLSTPLSSINISRNEIYRDSVETLFQNQLTWSQPLETGPLSHQTVSGLEISKETSDPFQKDFSGVPGTSLVNPDMNQTFSGTFTTRDTHVSVESVAAFALDTISLGEQWDVIAGVRWDQLNTSYRQTLSNSPTTTELNTTDSKLSWRSALVYKPSEEASVYAGYGTSFNPSAESLSLTVGTSSLKPEENSTFEVGSKWEIIKQKLLTRIAAFRTEKNNARETDPSNSNNVVLAGLYRVDGIEMEMTGRLTPEWQASMAYTYMQSSVLQSQLFPTSVGQPLANTPAHTFSFWTTYDLQKNWQVGGGANFVDSRRATNVTSSSSSFIDPVTGLPREVPSYWTFSAMTSYRISPQWQVQLNVNNLFNVTYYDQVHNAHIVPGEGRTFTLSSKLNF